MTSDLTHYTSFTKCKRSFRKGNSLLFIISSNYNYEPNSMSNILQQLKLQSLTERRKQNRLILLFKGLYNKACIPLDSLMRPSRTSRSGHPLPFKTIYARTDAYKFSFIPDTITHWNKLSPSIISSALNTS